MLSHSRFAVFTDMHFGIHANNSQFIGICRDTMNWITSYCVIEGIRDVLFCGDFFDSRSSIDVNTMNAATESLYGMAESGIGVTMVLGNHDIYLRDSTSIHSLLAFGGHGGIDIVDKPTCATVGDFSALLLPWSFSSPSSDAEVPENAKYAFCHHGFPPSFFMRGGKNVRRKKNASDSSVSATPYEDELGIRNDIVESVVRNSGVVFSGHIHQSSEIPLPNGAKLIIGGSPYETGWGFGKSKCGMYVFDTESGDVRFVPNPHNREHVEIRTSEKESVDEDRICGNIVRIVVDTQEPFDSISKLQSKIRSMNPFMVDCAKYEFEQSGFSGKRDESENPMQSVCGKPSSKLDYVVDAIGKADFSQFTYHRCGKQLGVSKETLVAMASELFERTSIR